MRQAIEEGFILDVLSNYTTYNVYYRLLKNAEDDPNLPKKKAARALAKFASFHPHNIEQKTEVIVEHFRSKVRHRLGNRAKAMVVTASRLEALKHELDQAQVYYWSEVENFAGVFYKAPEDQRPSDHADMQKYLQPAITRFAAIEQDDAREQFRDKLSGYVGLYAYLSQIVPYGDPEQEMLYSYGYSLLPHLPLDRDDAVIKLGSEVALQYYRLERVSSGPINAGKASLSTSAPQPRSVLAGRKTPKLPCRRSSKY